MNKSVYSISSLIYTMTILSLSFHVSAKAPFDEPPINYSQEATNDPIAKLQEAIDQGKTKLTYDENQGYLRSLLKALNVPIDSQVLIFAKTSFQREKISPSTPRALYFSDDMYIGWVQGGKVLEISSVDPKQGAIFYSLRQRERGKPKFIRHNSECLQCHGSSMTRNIPGHIVRSVFSDQSGFPILRLGSHIIDHDSPFENRWGGWYVSGTHGNQRHMGNVVVKDEDAEDDKLLNTDKGANVTDLSQFFNTQPYLTPHSDIVALMVLEHQSRAHNLITEANYATRRASLEQSILNELSGDPKDKSLPFVERRLSHTGERLLKYILYANEAPLTEPIKGTSGFAKQFEQRTPKDAKGRSLFQFDLKTRVFKYQCSYLIYSEAFNNLPARMKQYIYKRLHEILTGEDTSKEYKKIKPEQRKAILEILKDTKPEFSTWLNSST